VLRAGRGQPTHTKIARNPIQQLVADRKKPGSGPKVKPHGYVNWAQKAWRLLLGKGPGKRGGVGDLPKATGWWG